MMERVRLVPFHPKTPPPEGNAMRGSSQDSGHLRRVVPARGIVKKNR